MALVSVTEGEDKPLKYPQLFNSADVVVVTKTDIADAVEWDRDAALSAIRTIAPEATVLETSRTHRCGRARCWIFLLDPGDSEISPSVNCRRRRERQCFGSRRRVQRQHHVVHQRRRTVGGRSDRRLRT